MSEPAAPPSAPTGPAAAHPGHSAPPYGQAPPVFGEIVRPFGEVRLAPGSTVKYRSPIVVGVLTVVTLGIYTVVWWYLINKELADHGRATGRSDLGADPARSTLALFPGALVVVPAVWTTVTTFQRVQAAQRGLGRVPLNGWLALALALLFSPAMHAYLQSGLNSAWAAAATTGG